MYELCSQITTRSEYPLLLNAGIWYGLAQRRCCLVKVLYLSRDTAMISLTMISRYLPKQRGLRRAAGLQPFLSLSGPGPPQLLKEYKDVVIIMSGQAVKRRSSVGRGAGRGLRRVSSGRGRSARGSGRGRRVNAGRGRRAWGSGRGWGGATFSAGGHLCSAALCTTLHNSGTGSGPWQVLAPTHLKYVNNPEKTTVKTIWIMAC